MKKAFLYLFIGLSLVVWLVEMFTGWFDQAFLHQAIRGVWGLGFMILTLSLFTIFYNSDKIHKKRKKRFKNG